MTTYFPSQPSREVTFRAVAHLISSVPKDRDRTDIAVLCTRTRQTPERVRAVVGRAEVAGLVAVDRNVVCLTAGGRSLRNKIKAYKGMAQETAHESFRPYTEYQPRGWRPPRHRAF